MNRRSSEVTTLGKEADSARERIERYKEKRRQELLIKYGPLNGETSRTSLRNGRTEQNAKTDGKEGSHHIRDQVEKEILRPVRETKASRLRAANLNAKTEEKSVPLSQRRESMDKSQVKKPFFNRSHASPPTKEDSLAGNTSSRRSSSLSSNSLSMNGHSPRNTANRRTINTNSTDLGNQSSKSTLRVNSTKVPGELLSQERNKPNLSAIATSSSCLRKATDVCPSPKLGNSSPTLRNTNRRSPRDLNAGTAKVPTKPLMEGYNGEAERPHSFCSLPLTNAISPLRDSCYLTRRTCQDATKSKKLVVAPLISPVSEAHPVTPIVPSVESPPLKPSILKKKSIEEQIELSQPKPSILKRKTLSQDGAVTFSPSVVERDQSKRKPGILKKRRSLDESEVRRRCSSPDKSILKNQRRSSMEEINSILKRDSTETLHEPHSILKRKAASPSPQQHVMIADSVITALGGDHSFVIEGVRPILKKKSSFEEHAPEMLMTETPRPILKKKSVEVEDVPIVKPILKSSRKSSEEELLTTSILKKTDEDHLRRPRSVCSHERARSAPPSRLLPRPLSLSESGTDYFVFLRNELQWTPPPTPVDVASKALQVPEIDSLQGDSASVACCDRENVLEQGAALADVCTPLLMDESKQHCMEGNEKDLVESTGSQHVSPGNFRKNFNQESTHPGEDLETEDVLSRMSLSDRVKLFNNRIKDLGAEPSSPLPTSRRPRSARFKTQPVTDEEITLVRSKPPGAVFVLPTLPSAPSGLKGILKHSSNASTSESDDKDVKSDTETIIPVPTLVSKPILKLKLPTGDDESENCKIDEKLELERANSCLVKSQSNSSVTSVYKKTVKDYVSLKGSDENSVLEKSEQPLHGLRRSTTQPLPQPPTNVIEEDLSGLSIKERLARLRQNGEINWQKRKSKLKAADELSIVSRGNCLNGCGEKSSILVSRLGELDTARQSWKSRVQPSDAVQFTVEGKMGLSNSSPSSSDFSLNSPKQARFRSKNYVPELHSSPASPDVTPLLPRSLSAPGGDETPEVIPNESGPTVPVPRADDETFEAFYQSLLPPLPPVAEVMDIDVTDLNAVQRSDAGLLVQKRKVQVQRRKQRSSRNPVKSLALRSDLLCEYMELKTGVVEKELRRLNVEKVTRCTSLAVEALAGLASTEDFTSVNLRKPTAGAVQYPETMLLRIKGRRHVETRLVEPSHLCVNKGDCFLLVKRDFAALYVGDFSNVVERAKAKEIAARVEAGELACSIARVSGEGRFWSVLSGEPMEAGSIDEDERIETAMAACNMTYELQDHELVPISTAWGVVPKVEILNPHKNLVFDFGTEMYVWSGKYASLSSRREAAALAREMWDEGFDYSGCDWSPFGQLIGKRPSWALFCRITQNMEPVIFREKFLDWPEFVAPRNISVSEPDGSSMMEVMPCDAQTMWRERLPWPDLELEGSHLGRGVSHLDEETRRVSEVSDVKLTVWRVSEYDLSEITDPADLGQFMEDNSYIVRWHYSVSVTVRGLDGLPSRHSAPGRDRYVYFIWHGRKSSAADRGAAAHRTVALDSEGAPQMVVLQLSEPPAFLRLFDGTLAVHRRTDEAISLYLVRGSSTSEAMLLEVDLSMRSLRSKACFLLIDRISAIITLWCGCLASEHTKKIARYAAEKVNLMRPVAYRLPDKTTFSEVSEGCEPHELLIHLAGNRKDYYSLIDAPLPKNGLTQRLFHFTNTGGGFGVQEVTSPLLHPEGSSPYIFLQSDLYSVSQPALFVLDTGDHLWLWHGWPEDDTAPSALVRFQGERRAAMQTAVQYWEFSRNEAVKGSLVWAGLEPLEFINLFPFWENREDVAEINQKAANHSQGEIVDLETELTRLMCTRYPISVLLQRPLPDGVDPTQLEDYLEPGEFPLDYSETVGAKNLRVTRHPPQQRREENKMASIKSTFTPRENEPEVSVTQEDQVLINHFSKISGKVRTMTTQCELLKIKAKSYEDADEELILMDEDDPSPLPILLGDTFFYLSLERSKKLMKETHEDLQKQVEALEKGIESRKDILSDIKTTLYGKFGSHINLEEERLSY